MGRQTSAQGGTRFRMLRAQFWTLAQISRLFGDTVGASLVRGPGCQLVVAMMCDADVCGLIPTTRLKRVFEWGVKQAPREAPDSEC